MKKTLLILTAFALCTTAFSQIPNYVPSNGLVGWWPFNGNANDESGNGNNGTVNGATLTNDRNGVPNSAYYFSGNGCATYIACNINTANITSGLTVSFWAKRNGNGCIVPRIMKFYAPSDGPGTVVFNWPNSANVGMGFVTSSYASPFYNFNNVNNNVWTFFCYTNNGSQAKLYQNGNLISQHISSGSISLAGNATFGRMTNPAHDALNGDIDDVGIWNRALSACEIQDLYNAQLNFANSTINAGPDQFICFGDSVALLASGGFNYQWDNNVIDSQYFIPSSNSQYVVQGEDSIGCFGYDTVFVTVFSNNSISAGADQNICAGDNVTLSGAGGSNYQWNNNVVDGQAFAPTQSNVYVVNGTDTLGCQGTDTVIVTVLENASSTLTQTALDSYTLNGQTYTQSGTYTQTLAAANGCDSTITLNLTLNFTGMDELGTSAKKLVKITDLNGKIIPRRKNTLMLFIYEDGTVKRVVEMEE
jgi:hypothetical protein